MSTTYIANIVQILVGFLPFLGVNIEHDQLVATVANVATVGAAVWIFVGRFRAGGIHWWGGRKAP